MEYNIYLNFQDESLEALDHYGKVFNTKAEGVMLFKDMPVSEDFKVAQEDLEKVLYSQIRICNRLIMISDCPLSMGKIEKGNNFSICVQLDSKEEVDAIFNGLSEGGQITMPPSKTFFSEYYGQVIDKFGVSWAIMVQDKSNNHV